MLTLPLPRPVTKLTQALSDSGLRPLLVGGYVRDALRGQSPKDLDIEVYGGSLADVHAVLAPLARVDEVGASFGVLKVTLPGGIDLDVSVPRRDNKTGTGHRGFTVEHDPTMTVAEAASRRDFTINAMSWDPATGELIDPWGGKDDLDARVLRHVSDAFAEDPLRVWRAVQFAARFGMTLAPATIDLCRSLRSEAQSLAVERVRGEWAKFYTKGRNPGAGVQALRVTGWADLVPGLQDLDNVDALTLTTQLARAVKLSDAQQLTSRDRIVLQAAVVASSMRDSDATAFLRYTVDGKDAQRMAYRLSRCAVPEVTASWVRRAAREFAPLPLRRVAAFLDAYHAGVSDLGDRVERMATDCGVLDAPEPDLLTGEDLLASQPGRKPGPWISQLVTKARDAQADGEFRTRSEALAWLAALQPGRVCPSCGHPWDDTLFTLACGCTLVGHSESQPAQAVRDGGSGMLYCSQHQWVQLVAVSALT